MNRCLDFARRFVALVGTVIESDEPINGADAVDFIRDQYEAAQEAIRRDTPRKAEEQLPLDLVDALRANLETDRAIERAKKR